MGKTKKLLLMFLIFIIGITITITSRAAALGGTWEIFKGEVADYYSDSHYVPWEVAGGTEMCIDPGGPFNSRLTGLTRELCETWRRYEYWEIDTKYRCQSCYTTEPPWPGILPFMRYRLEQTIPMENYQDTAYVLADTIENEGSLLANPVNTQQKVKGTSIVTRSNKSPIGNAGNEGVEYKKFYEKLRQGFENIVQNNTEKAEANISQATGEYIIGPINISYPTGQYNGKNKFAWINDIRLVTDDGEFSVSSGVVQVVDASGNPIKNIGKYEENTLSERTFYLKVKNTEMLEIQKIKIKFGYVDHCEATAQEYVGRIIGAYWEQESKSYNSNDVLCNGHERKVIDYEHPVYKTDEETGDRVFDYYPTHTEIDYHGGIRYHYTEKELGKCQKHMWVKDASKVIKEETIEIDVGKIIVKEKNKEQKAPPVAQPQANPGNTPGTPGTETTPPGGNTPGTPGTETTPPGGNTPTPPGGDTPTPPGGNTPTPPGDEPDEPYDNNATFDIAGYVFLDQDNGKVNEGNNVSDDGEALGGIEVYLYDSSGAEVGKTLTDTSGYYIFAKLNAQRKYYVEFVYNGLLYTNVDRLAGNAENISKATEEAKNSGNRQSFNNAYGTIGSEPQNYKIRNKVFGNDLGDYNKVYLQEEVESLFKEVAYSFGDVSKWSSADIETKRKVQFVYDCRITARSTETYPLIDNGIGKTYPVYAAGVQFYPLYGGAYDQLHVNLGIKARPTVDLSLYKDVLKADVVINGKTETYNYDVRKASGGFSVGISESDYLNGLRGAYKDWNSYSNTTARRDIEADSYTMDMRTEEVANGQSTNYNKDATGKVSNNYQLNYDYENLQGNSSDRLKIFVTYKLAIQNQSSTVSAITEIVDYFDPNFVLTNAYVGDVNGNKTGDVKTSESSIYGNNTAYKSANGTYKTIYITPTSETKLGNNEQQYIYVTLQLLGPNGDAGTLLSSKLLNNEKLTVLNLAEINGYKTYYSKDNTATPGLIDKDSISGNLNISNINELTVENIINYPNIRNMYEDDTSRAPAYVFSLLESRTIEGTVFEDTVTAKNKQRTGNGTLDNGEKGIEGVIVELVEIKNGQMIVRSTTTTNANGWYGFTGFLPGEYTIRFTYGSNDATAMSKTSWYAGANDVSFNGQDYQSTKYRNGEAINSATYTTDSALINKYNTNNANKNGEESAVNCEANQIIDTYGTNNYWYTVDSKLSDARDDAGRVQQVINYSRNEYDGREIVNHKAEVFNAYVNPQPSHITKEFNRSLADELERRTYRYAYTPQIEVEVEYATESITGNQGEYVHAIKGMDFGIAERPRSELTIDQDVKHIKVTATDGTVLFDTENGVYNLQWISKGNTNKYDKGEKVNIIMDDELISGANIEITYNLTVTNNSEEDAGTLTRAKTILNYVGNNINFDAANNKDANGNDLWKVVSKDSVQNGNNSTFVNNTNAQNELKLIDLSTQTTILQATENNPLAKTQLKPGESVTSTLVLKKTLSAESAADDLTYTNLTEITEIENTVGRYDHGAIPGNQSLVQQPQEHDASGATKYVQYNENGLPDNSHEQDGTVVITPPTGSNVIYYALGIGIAILLAGGIVLIKKFAIKK